MQILTELVERLQDMPALAVYVIAGLLLAAEVGVPFGLFVPAASIMLTMGALASAGRIDLAVAIAVAVFAALLGDSIGYWEGRLTGPRLRATRLGRRIGAQRWRQAERVVHRGAAAITIGRWTAFARTFVPRVAGAAGVRYRRFLVLNAAAIVVWMPGTILIGYVGADALW
jgi:membrane protein DedA with SNARE-associated domain